MKSSANVFFDILEIKSNESTYCKQRSLYYVVFDCFFFGGGGLFILKLLNRDYEAHSELVMAVTCQKMNDSLLKARRRSRCETELSRGRRRRREVNLLDL